VVFNSNRNFLFKKSYIHFFPTPATRSVHLILLDVIKLIILARITMCTVYMSEQN
jgi:hypothetical protein